MPTALTDKYNRDENGVLQNSSNSDLRVRKQQKINIETQQDLIRRVKFLTMKVRQLEKAFEQLLKDKE